MSHSRLFAAYLRRPDGPKDPRDDPFYFRGSFGSTGCHSTNLLHPAKKAVTTGDRLCFIQPGTREPRIVHITPSITLRRVALGRRRVIEVLWPPAPPLKYEFALPLTIDLARCFNPNADDESGTIHSYFRTYSRPAVAPEVILSAYDEWCQVKGEAARAATDRETLDHADQNMMHLTVYGSGGHLSSSKIPPLFIQKGPE